MKTLIFKLKTFKFNFGYHSQGGYIALMSAVIIASVLLIITFSISERGFKARFNLLDSSNKEKGYQAASACANQAILEIIKDNAYPGNANLDFANESCFIRPINLSGSQYTIQIQSIVGKTYTNIETVFNLSTLSITSWKELPSF